MDSAALVERLFSRFVALYGSQKVGAMWADADVSEVKAVWARKLVQYQPQTIGRAIDMLIDSGREWPPTLPEFAEMCRQAAVGRVTSQGPMLAAPGQTRTDRETAKRKVAELIEQLAQSKKIGATAR